GDDLAPLLADVEPSRHAERIGAGDQRLVLAEGVGPRDHLDDTVLVLEEEGRVAVPLAAVLEAQALHHAGERDLVLARQAAQVAGLAGDQARELLLEAIERVGGDEEAERL